MMLTERRTDILFGDPKEESDRDKVISLGPRRADKQRQAQRRTRPT